MFKNIFKPIGFSLLVVCANAHAATVHLSGITVDFYYDDAQPGMAAYGMLSAVGDSIFATPTNFLATSSGVEGVINTDTFSALGTIKVVAKAGYQFIGAGVVQEGDYRLQGLGTSVSLVGDLTVSDFNNAATNVMTTMINSDLENHNGLINAWNSSGQLDLSTPIWNNITSINLSLSSTLTASTSALGELAFIQNKFVGGAVTVTTSPVPIPAAMWLFASGLFGLIGFSRKIKNQ